MRDQTNVVGGVYADPGLVRFVTRFIPSFLAEHGGEDGLTPRSIVTIAILMEGCTEAWLREPWRATHRIEFHVTDGEREYALRWLVMETQRRHFDYECPERFRLYQEHEWPIHHCDTLWYRAHDSYHMAECLGGTHDGILLVYRLTDGAVVCVRAVPPRR